MTRTHIDDIAKRYVTSLDANLSYIRTTSNRSNHNFAVSFDRVAPEILSRLCYKCSISVKHLIADYLHGAYKRATTTSFSNVDTLARRLLNSLSSQERMDIVPRLLGIPIPPHWTPGFHHLLGNPLTHLELDSHVLSKLNKPAIREGDIYSLIDDASTTSTDASREWALQSLQVLHFLGLLDNRQSRRFSVVLWRHRDESSFPSQPEQPRYQFLELPHPAKLDVIALFKSYVKDSSFPVQGTKPGVTLHNTWRIGLAGEIVGATGKVDWTDEELVRILDGLFSWWHTDKERLRVQ